METPQVDLYRSTIIYQYKTKIATLKLIFFFIGLTRKQDGTHEDHNQLNDPLPLYKMPSTFTPDKRVIVAYVCIKPNCKYSPLLPLHPPRVLINPSPKPIRPHHALSALTMLSPPTPTLHSRNNTSLTPGAYLSPDSPSHLGSVRSRHDCNTFSAPS